MVGTARLRVAGEPLIADQAVGMFWPRHDLLVVADLDLEEGASYAARGVPLPPYDTPDTLSAVEALVRRYRPRTVIALGDSFHREDSHSRLVDRDRDRIRALTAATGWIWISGNHDPRPPTGLGGETAEDVSIGALTFRHEPCPTSGFGEIAGHLHPAAKLRRRGRAIRRRCFAASETRVIMPAMGAYAGGLNVLDPAFAFLFPAGRFHAWMIGSERIYPIPASKLSQDPGAALSLRSA